MDDTNRGNQKPCGEPRFSVWIEREETLRVSSIAFRVHLWLLVGASCQRVPPEPREAIFGRGPNSKST